MVCSLYGVPIRHVVERNGRMTAKKVKAKISAVSAWVASKKNSADRSKRSRVQAMTNNPPATIGIAAPQYMEFR